jgi:hypothetical protein
MILVCGLHLLLFAAFRYAFTKTVAGDASPTPGLLYLWTSTVPEAPRAPPAAMPARPRIEFRPPPAHTSLSNDEETKPLVEPARNNPITIDWASEATRSAAAIAASKDSAPGHAMLESRPADSAHRRSHSFQWDPTVTQRIEAIPGGGTLIKLNDHCGLTFAPLPMLGCWLGHREANGHLFDDMNDATRRDAP